MNQRYILTILSRRRGKNHKNERYFRGTYEQAREAAQGIRKSCDLAGRKLRDTIHLIAEAPHAFEMHLGE